MTNFARDLRRAEKAYRDARTRADRERVRRNALVYDAIEAGWTHARIADAMGVTRGRINQIAMRRPNR